MTPSAARSAPEKLEKRGRAASLLADVLLDVLDALCDGTEEYAQLRDRVKPLLDEVSHGKRR
jgi:hypothetical protein